MGNKKAREVVKQRERDLEWERAWTTPRAITTNIHGFGIGERRLQLIVLPAFRTGHAWEVRRLDEQWMLYRSEILVQLPLEVQLVGYEQVPMERKTLRSFFERLTALSISLEPDLSGRRGCDGTLTQVAVFGSLLSEWRFQWWDDAPAKWKALTDLAAEMLAAFLSAESTKGSPGSLQPPPKT